MKLRIQFLIGEVSKALDVFFEKKTREKVFSGHLRKFLVIQRKLVWSRMREFSNPKETLGGRGVQVRQSQKVPPDTAVFALLG